MSIEWRRLCVGLSSGLFQSPSYLLPQFIAAIAVAVGASGGQLAWLAPCGYVLPVLMGLLVATGDRFGGRALILGTATLTLLGVALIAAAGLAAAHHANTLALGLAIVGAGLIPAAVRHGALVVAHETRGLGEADQLRESRALRRYLVLGIYLIPLPAGLIAARHGWVWVFGLLALGQLAALLLLAEVTKADRRWPRPSPVQFGRDLAACFRNPRLGWAAAGAFAAQATVFAYVGGLPICLAAQGYTPGVIGAIAFAAVLAVLFVTRPRSRSSARFGRWAGAAPLAGLLIVATSSLLDPRHPDGAVAGWTFATVVHLAALALTSVLIELSKQWSQVIALLQARAGARSDQDYRRQAVVGLGANLGAVAGAGLGPWSATVGEPAWLTALLVVAAAAWALQASWFASAPHRLREIGEGRSRWRHRGHEYLVATGPGMLGWSWTAIYDAAGDHDEIQLHRQRAGFDPAATTVTEQLHQIHRRR